MHGHRPLLALPFALALFWILVPLSMARGARMEPHLAASPSLAEMGTLGRWQAHVRGTSLGPRLLPVALRHNRPGQLVSVYVVLESAPEAAVALRGGSRVQDSRDQGVRIAAEQAAIKPRLAALGARELYSFRRLANAIQVRVPAGRLEEIAALPGVLRVEPVGRYSAATETSVPFIGADKIWSNKRLDLQGEGISIGVIDTGIDYTHADFAGPGDPDAYLENDPRRVERGSFPNAKVVGGYDFVGEDYDAESPVVSDTIPVPDPDPLDCHGHGTHVAGIAAGFGVTSAGETYSGDYYSGLYADHLFEVGPGVAPAADLYALKIFGCRGLTEVLLPALEWAADPNGDGNLDDRLDVLNLSIGCDFTCGVPTEIEAINLLGQLGTFVAASAGNDGNTFYASGEPANADYAISVAASVAGGAQADQVADFSSRGPRSPDNALKPELAAPGLAIRSAAIGTGARGLSLSGTSMAVPHVAGAAALLRQEHPNFSVEELKALLMNTAATTRDANGSLYPESRVGSGRVRVDVASEVSVTVRAEQTPGLVALSFGALSPADTYTQTQTLRLTNHADEAVRYTISVAHTVTESGVSVTPLVSTVTVAARGSALVPVRLVAVPELLDRSGDSTTPSQQLGLPRHRLYEVSGQIRFAGRVHTLRVPYYAAIRPASDLHAQVADLATPAGGPDMMSMTVPISGTTAHPRPIVSAFQLGAESPAQPRGDPLRAPADLLAVGAASDVASQASFTETSVYFGIATLAGWSTPQPAVVEFDVYIDTNRDGTDDYVLFNSNAGAADNSDDTDTFVTVLRDLESGETEVQSFVNVLGADVLESLPFNNSVLILPVGAAALGLTVDYGAFDYYVVSHGNGVMVDRSERATFDAARPAIDAAVYGINGAPMFADGRDIRIQVNRDALARYFSPARPAGVLLLHHMNQEGSRVDVVKLHERGKPLHLFLPVARR